MTHPKGPLRKFNPATLYEPQGNYFNAVEVPERCKMVFSSGIVGIGQDGHLVHGVKAQIQQAWANVASFLEGCLLKPDNLVHMTMYLTDPNHVAISKAARVAALGEPMHCAVTGVIVGLFDPDLFIEIDVVAAADV